MPGIFFWPYPFSHLMKDTCHMSSGLALPSQSPRPVLYMGPLQQHWAAEPRRHQKADGITQFHRQFSLCTFSLYTTRAYTRAEMPPLPQASLWSSLAPTIGSSWVPSPASHSWATAVQKYQGLEFAVILCPEGSQHLLKKNMPLCMQHNILYHILWQPVFTVSLSGFGIT